jgi:hypothetical protein
MANNIAFSPMGNTSVIACGTTSNSTTVTAYSPVNQFMCVNTGTVPAFIVANTSNITATIATSGSPGNAFCIAAGATKVVTYNQAAANTTVYFAGITSTGSANVYITPGEGL